MRRALLLAFLTACRQPAPAASSSPATFPAPSARASAPADESRAACIDAQLGARHLNPYGDPPDTVYAGGSPLFDEKTSATRDRIPFVLAKHPEIGQVCAAR